MHNNWELLTDAPRLGTKRGQRLGWCCSKHGAAPMGEQRVPGTSLAALCWDAPWRTSRRPGKSSSERGPLELKGGKTPFLLPASPPKSSLSIPQENKVLSLPGPQAPRCWLRAAFLLPSFLLLQGFSSLFQDTARLFFTSLLQTGKVQERLQ